MATELGVAYLSILPETSKLAPNIRKALGSAEKDSESTGRNIGSRMSGALGSALKTGALVAGTAAVGLLGTALYKGFSRLTGIENATAKLTGLGHSAESVRLIMDNALASVKGTAFGLADAATVAATTVASGIKPGKDLERILRLVADSATIAGTDLGSMGAIFSKVAASNKIQGDVIAQLNDAGIPIVQLLGKELGKTASEVVEMASAGEIGFATFADAMEAGLGGAAQESGATLEGAFANVQAALGRIGAGLLVGVFPQIKGFFNGSIDLLGTLEGRAQEIGQRIGDALAGTFAWVGPKIRETAGYITNTLTPAIMNGGNALVGWLTPKFQALSDVVRTSVIPAVSGFAGEMLDKIVPALQAVGAWIMDVAVPAMVEFFKSSTFLNGMSMLWETLGSVLGSVGDVFSALWPAVKQLAEMLGDLFVEMKPGIVATLKGAFVGLNVALRVAGKVVAGVAKVIGAIVDWFYRWQDILVPLIAGVAAFVAVIKIYRMTVIAIAAVQAAWSAATLGMALAAWAAAGAFSAANAALLANPIVLVIAIIAGLVAAFVVAYKKSETFRDVVNATWAAMKIAAEVVFNGIKWVIVNVFNAVKAFIDVSMAVIKALFSSTFTAVSNTVTTIMGGVQSTISRAISTVLGIFRGMGSIVTTVVGFFTSMKDGSIRKAGELVTWLSGLPGRVLSTVTGFATLLFNAGKSLIQGLINGIRNKFDQLRGAMGAVGTIIGGFLPGSPIRTGPLTSWNGGGAGKRLMGFLIDGIESATPGVGLAAAGAANSIAGAGFSTPPIGVGRVSGAGVEIPTSAANQGAAQAGMSARDIRLEVTLGADSRTKAQWYIDGERYAAELV